MGNCKASPYAEQIGTHRASGEAVALRGDFALLAGDWDGAAASAAWACAAASTSTSTPLAGAGVAAGGRTPAGEGEVTNWQITTWDECIDGCYRQV